MYKGAPTIYWITLQFSLILPENTSKQNQKHGVKGNELWFESYLTSRYQFVEVGLNIKEWLIKCLFENGGL